MKPVYQTRFGTEGNCLAACFASILECSLEDVDFSALQSDDWYLQAVDVLRRLGAIYIYAKAAHDDDGLLVIRVPFDAPYFIACGPSGSGADHNHAVVCRFTPSDGPHGCRWDVVHDPHQPKIGIKKVTHIRVVARPIHRHGQVNR